MARDFKDIHKTAFKSFLKKAAQAYFDNVRELQSDPIKGQPWKADGRAWHLSQQSIHARHRVLWRPSLILELIGRISKFAPDIEFDWTGKIGIGMGRKGQTKRIGKIVTNLGAGVRCEFRVVKGALTPLQIEKLGTSPLIQPRADHDVLTFGLRSIKDNDSTQFARVLANTRMEVSDSTAESA